jgi:ribose transport system substrate-binding protein
MKKRGFIALALAGLMMVCALAGCGSGGSDSSETSGGSESSSEASGSTETATKGDGLVIKFIAMSSASVYWTSLQQGAEAAAEEFGDEWGGIEIQFAAPEADTDTQKQVELIENAISQGVDGMLISPSSPTVPHDAIVDAVDAGIKVICVDQYLDPMDADAFFGTDGVAMTTELAEYMGEQLDGEGSYAQMVYNMTSLASIDRYDGFVAGMTEVCPDLKDAGYTVTDSDINATASYVSNVYQANPDLKLIFGNNDRSTIGVINGIKELGLEGEIKVCGVDCNLDLLKAMREGTISALALQMPYNQGYEGVKMILTLLEGGEVEKEGDSGSFLLTPENMDSDEAVEAIRQYVEGYEPEDSQI